MDRKNSWRNKGQKLAKFDTSYKLTDPRSSVNESEGQKENYTTAHNFMA